MPGLRVVQARHVGRQSGAASLVVVMILFFVISMVAAYTNRNLIFEQKTAANQTRSTRALEAADAGLEWALTMLNSGRLDNNCVTSANPADPTFRERYLVIDPANGNITPRKRADGVSDHYPTCVYDGATWNCSCPVNADPVVAAPADNKVYPAFRVRFRRVCAVAELPDTTCVTPVSAGVIHIDVNACTSLNEACLRFTGIPESLPGEGRASVHVAVGLRNALPSKPIGAVTARGAVGATFSSVVNSEVTQQGVTVHSGTAYDTTLTTTLQGKAGAPGASTLRDGDTWLSDPGMTSDRFFAAVFGVWKDMYRQQPGAIVVDCAVVVCNAATLRAMVALNPGRVYWVTGDLALDSAGDIGSALQPVVINVNGNVTFTAAVDVYGVVYSQAANWNLGVGAGASNVFGAAFAEGAMSGTASNLNIVYHLDVLTRLRTLTGSFVRVPGTWKDFET